MKKRQSGHAMGIALSADEVRALAEKVTAGRPDGDGLLKVYAAAQCILVEALGFDWYQRVLGAGTPTATYFRTKVDDGDSTAVLGQARSILLAEAIFNLRGVPGFCERLEQMKARCDLHGMYAELAWPGLFRQKGIPVEFRIDLPDQSNPDLLVRTRCWLK